MLDLIVSWLISAIAEAFEEFVAFFSGIFGYDSAAFVDTFSFAGDAYTVIQSVALALTLLIAGWQIVVFFWKGADNASTTPVRAGMSVLLAIGFIYYGNYILDMILEFCTYPYDSLNTIDAVDFQVENGPGTVITVGISAIFGQSSALLLLIIFIMICIAFGQLLLEMIERYFVTFMLVYLSPLASATLASPTTSNIFKKYFTMFITQCLLVFLGLWGMKMGLSAMAAGGDTPAIIRLLLSYSAFKIAAKMDNYLNQLGLNAAQTGGGLGNAILAAGATMLSMKGGKGGVLGGVLGGAGGAGGTGGAAGGILGFGQRIAQLGNRADPVRAGGKLVADTIGGAFKGGSEGFRSGVGLKDRAAKALEGIKTGGAEGAKNSDNLFSNIANNRASGNHIPQGNNGASELNQALVDKSPAESGAEAGSGAAGQGSGGSAAATTQKTTTAPVNASPAPVSNETVNPDASSVSSDSAVLNASEGPKMDTSAEPAAASDGPASSGSADTTSGNTSEASDGAVLDASGSSALDTSEEPATTSGEVAEPISDNAPANTVSATPLDEENIPLQNSNLPQESTNKNKEDAEKQNTKNNGDTPKKESEYDRNIRLWATKPNLAHDGFTYVDRTKDARVDDSAKVSAIASGIGVANVSPEAAEFVKVGYRNVDGASQIAYSLDQNGISASYEKDGFEHKMRVYNGRQYLSLPQQEREGLQRITIPSGRHYYVSTSKQKIDQPASKADPKKAAEAFSGVQNKNTAIERPGEIAGVIQNLNVKSDFKEAESFVSAGYGKLNGASHLAYKLDQSGLKAQYNKDGTQHTMRIYTASQYDKMPEDAPGKADTKEFVASDGSPYYVSFHSQKIVSDPKTKSTETPNAD